MAYATHSGDFGLCGDRTAPVASGVGAKLSETRSPSDRRPRRTAAEGGRPGDCPPPGALRRTHHGQHGARNHGEGSGVRLEPAAVAASSSVKAQPLDARVHADGVRVFARVSLSPRLTRMSTRAPSTRVIRSSARCGRTQAGRSVGSSSGPLQRRRRPANLCPRAFAAVALQSVPGRRERAPGVGIGARIGRQWSRHR